VIDIVRQLR